jgi:hypothetical protein
VVEIFGVYIYCDVGNMHDLSLNPDSAGLFTDYEQPGQLSFFTWIKPGLYLPRTVD